ncbi:MAG: class I SAM-dependent methyltransferase [Gaiellaceae bacterium]
MTYPERIVPDETARGIVAIHLRRYAFAQPYCEGKDVLDAACGVGYGTVALAETAARVVGADVDADAIAYARGRYARDNVEFVVADLLDPPFADASFDVVASFETIEHLREPETFVRHVARVLRPGGVFVVSTPRVDVTTLRPGNPFHEVEFSPADFETLLRRHFSRVDLYGQRRAQTGRHRLVQRLDVFGLRKRFSFLRRAAPLLGTPPMESLSLDDVLIERGAVDDATELVAVCLA